MFAGAGLAGVVEPPLDGAAAGELVVAGAVPVAGAAEVDELVPGEVAGSATSGASWLPLVAGAAGAAGVLEGAGAAPDCCSCCAWAALS